MQSESVQQSRSSFMTVRINVSCREHASVAPQIDENRNINTTGNMTLSQNHAVLFRRWMKELISHRFEGMDNISPNKTGSMAVPVQNISGVADSERDYITDTNILPDKWHYFLEAILVGIGALVGLAGNLAVVRGSVRAKRSTKQNVYLFIGLSLSDYFVCLLRGPCLIYIIFHTKNSPNIICEFWMMSTIFLVIAVITNMVVAIERRMIMYNFQRYLALFTPRKVFATIVVIWFSIIGCFLAIYKGMALHSVFRLDERSCDLKSGTLNLNEISATAFRSCAVVMFGVVPIMIQASCYISLVVKVYKAESMKLDKLDEKVTYMRITGIAFARVLVTVTCLFPALICFAIGPMYPDVYYSNVRFLDDLIILHSAISPFISMHDSDFRDTFFHWNKKCFCSFKRRTGSKKGSRRSNCITSADMKTLGLTK